MIFTLRHYQQDAVNKAVGYFQNIKDKKTKPALVLPTAAGKSLIVANIAKALDGKVLVFQPSRELILQNYAKYISYGLKASLFSASLKQKTMKKEPYTLINGEWKKCKEVGEVTFATIGSVKSCPELFKDVKYVIIDECDMYNPDEDGMYTKFFAAIGVTKVAGLTATPFRLKTTSSPFATDEKGYPLKLTQLKVFTRIRPKFFNKIIHVTQIKELYDGGYLTPIKYIPLKWNAQGLKLNSSRNEFDDSSVKLAMKLNNITEKVPAIIKQALAKGRKRNLVFVDSVQTAKDMAMDIKGSHYIDGSMKDERVQTLDAFRSGDLHTLINVGVLTTGYDLPILDNIVMARPTTSLRLAYQIYGRGIRLLEGAANYEESRKMGKENCTVVDLCDNYRRFGELSDWWIGDHPDHGWCMWDTKRNVPLTNVDIIP